jgi:hypothetical protein
VLTVVGSGLSQMPGVGVGCWMLKEVGLWMEEK